MKTCSNCHISKELTEFTHDRTKKDGLSHYCKVCKRELAAHRHQTKYKDKVNARSKKYRQIVSAAINAIKSHTGCVNCSENSHPHLLELHHVDATAKDFTVSASKVIKYTKLLDEISKCVCLCANCHRKVHLAMICVDDKIPMTVEFIDKLLENKKLQW